MKRFDLDTWEEILVTITRNKTRSLLTAFGVFWGIFMLIALMGGAQGMQDKLQQGFKGFATNSGFMGTNRTGKAYKGFQQGRAWDLENKDVERIRRSVSEIEVITPTLARWGIEAVYNEHKISGTLKGFYPEYSAIEEPSISYGRYLNDMDIRDRRKVCIIGKRIYETLFPEGGNPCGKFVEINGIYYQVIGVSMSTGNISVQGQSETSIIIPFSTMQQNYNFGQKIQLLCYTAKKGYSISEVEKKVEQVVKQAHLIHPDDEQAMVILNAEALFSMMDNLFSALAVRGLTLFGFCISVLQETTGIVLLEGLTPLAEIYPVICSIGAFLAGILPFFAFVQRLLTAPLAKLAARLQLEPASITGLVVTSANCIPTLLSLDTLEERGITLNTAYAVVAAYSVGDFLAFTLQFSPAHALPMMAGRLLSGLLAVVLCLKTTPKTT